MGLGLSLGIGWRGFGVNFGIWGMVGDGLNRHDVQAENCTIDVDKVIQESSTSYLQIIEDDEDYDDTLEQYNDEDVSLEEECNNNSD